jgi:Sensors of blue-light using FAD
MTSGNLIHCIYASMAKTKFSEASLAEILALARTNNASLDVTGILLYSEGSFFQVIEGDARVVDTLFAKIAADPRHEKVTKIIREPISCRQFSDWTMGYLMITQGEIEAIDGLNDFFTNGSCLAQIDNGRARKLLHRFADGRWRSRLGGATKRAVPA